MKTCAQFYNLIEDLLDGELDSQAAEQVNSHVFACPTCRDEYENRRREKEIFGQFLFDVEPPSDSWANFQRRLAAENAADVNDAALPAATSWPKNYRFIFGFSPAFAAVAGLLVIFGIGVFLMKTTSNPQSEVRETAAAPADSPVPRIERKPEIDSPPQTDRKALAKVKNAPTTVAKIQPVKRKSAPLAETANIANVRIKNLETEIAEQVEKVELLLRSFRNSREIDGASDTFDVGYERAQARRLLAANTRLRRDAEKGGIVYAEDVLSRVEPYLLEIANLEARPAPEKVLDIKERVNRQNIIASLQVY